MRFRGVKVILRDGLEVTDQVRKDMFLAWQDLQLLHATQPGLQYKYMISGNRSWKVSSLNGVDRIELLGYPTKKKIEKRKPKVIRRKRVNYLPSFNAYNAADELIGVIVCRGGGFNAPYEFIPTPEPLPNDIPSNEDFSELSGIRNWVYNGKEYKDIIPGKYTPTVSVMDAPNNTMSATWDSDLDVACCWYRALVPAWLTSAGYINSYTRSNSYNHTQGITFGPGEDEDWPAVWYERSYRNYTRPKEFILNLDESLYARENGSGSGVWADSIGADDCMISEGNCDCSLAQERALQDAQANYPTWEPYWNPYATEELHGCRNLTYEWSNFATWKLFCDPRYGLGESNIEHEYTNNRSGREWWNWYEGSIEDENHFALFYDISEWIFNQHSSKSFSGVIADCLSDSPETHPDCDCDVQPNPAIITDVDTENITLKIALNEYILDVSNYPEILGMGSEYPGPVTQNAAVRYFRDGGYEIGLYWLMGSYANYGANISNYVAVTSKGELIATPLTDNSPWSFDFIFPGITYQDEPVYIRDYAADGLAYAGRIRLIKETITSIEEYM